MMRNKRRIFFFAVVTLLLCQFSWAQMGEEEGLSKEITIEDAVRIALENNLELKALRERLDMAEGGLTSAGLFPNPEFETEILSTDAGNRIELRLSQEFQIGGQRGKRKNVGRMNLEKVRSKIADGGRLLTGEVREGFYEVVLLQEKVKLADQVVGLNGELAKIAGTQFRAGLIPEFEVNLARVKLQGALLEKMRVANELSISKMRLNNLLGRPAETALKIEGGLIYNPIELDLNLLKDFALEHRSDLRRLQFEERMMDQAVSLAKSERIPDIGLSAIYEQEPEGDRSFGAEVTIPLPLFNRNQGEIRTSLAEKRSVGFERENQERVVEREVTTAYMEYNLSKEVLDSYEKKILGLVEESLQLIRWAYRRGETGILEAVVAQEEFVEARGAYLDALFRHNVAIARLEEAIGGRLTEVK